MTVKCPRCGTEVEFEGNPYRPFCSERCKLIDLGKWIEGSYRLSPKAKEAEEESPPAHDEDAKGE